MANKTKTVVKAKKEFEQDGHKWLSGKQYPLVLGTKGFALDSEEGEVRGTFSELDIAMKNFNVPIRFVM